jgi:hypothetical protein
MSRQCFVGSVDEIGSDTASSAQLKRSKMGDFGLFRCFWSNSLVVVTFSGVGTLVVSV